MTSRRTLSLKRPHRTTSSSSQQRQIIHEASSKTFDHILSPSVSFTPESEKSDTDYNARYQCILDFFRDSFLSGEINTPDWEPAIQDLIVLEEEFTYYVETYARLIVTELYFPIEKKSLKPINDTTPNETFYLKNIIFKVARGWGSYCSDYIAAKIAGHTLKGIEAYSACFFLKLRLPLTAIVDYFGYRVICIATLDPTSSFHLRGSTQQLMKEANTKLNLTPLTNEILQMFDFSQALPPTAPRSIYAQEHLYQRFRKEAVQAYHKPLCPTVFSNSSETDPEGIQHNQDLQDLHDATTWLLEKLIPQSISKIALDITTNLLRNHFDQINLSYLLHREGINVRYLGVVFSHLAAYPTLAAGIVLIEIYARTIKNELRRLLRTTVTTYGLVNEFACQIGIIEYLNAIFTDTPSCFYSPQQNCWEVLTKLATHFFFLKQEEVIKFLGFSPSSLYHPSSLLKFPFHTVAGRCYLFRRVVDLMKLNFHESVHQRLESFQIPSLVSLFSVADFFGNSVSTKIQSILSIARPLFTFYHSQQWIVTKKMTLQFPRSTITGLKIITARSPSHPLLISYLAFAMSLDLSFNNIPWTDPDYQEAEDLFASVLNYWGTEHSRVLALCCLKYAQFQIYRREFVRANAYLRRALELNPKSSHYCQIFVQFLKDHYPKRVQQIRKYTRQAEALILYSAAMPTYQSLIHP